MAHGRDGPGPQGSAPPAFSRATIADLLGVPGIERADATILLGHVLDMTRAGLATHPEREVDEDAAARYRALAARRRRGEPVAYLVGSREFYGCDLEVTPAVLIPRPETELLVDLAVECLGERPARVLDLGSGSGAIAIAVARECPRAEVWAVDRSVDALAVARANAARNAVQVRFIESDWFAGLTGERFDLVLANPPYVAEDDPHLARGDLRFEPLAALACGSDGLDAIRAIVQTAPPHLVPGGVLALEHGFDQAGAVRQLLHERGLVGIETRRDLQGHERMTWGRLP